MKASVRALVEGLLQVESIYSQIARIVEYQEYVYKHYGE